MLKASLIKLLLGVWLSRSLLLLPFLTYAESINTLTVDQAIETALINNPQLKAARARVGVADAQRITAGARLNPSIVSDNGIAEKTYRLGIEQTLELGGKRKKRVALAEAQRNAVASDTQAVVLDLRADVRRAYTRLYNAQERQSTLENILEVAQELAVIARKRQQAGDISALDVLQTDIVRVNAQNDEQTATAEIANTKARLNVLLNQPLDTPLHLAPPNTTPQITSGAPPSQAPPGTLQGRVVETDLDLNRLVEQALAQRPELQKNRLDIEGVRLQEAMAKANRIPNLQIAAGPDYVAEPSQRQANVFIVGTLELPVFNRQQGPIQEALARQKQLEQEQAVLKNQIVLEVTTAYNAFRMNQERIKRYETRILPLAVAVTVKSRLAFQEGKTAILTPISAQQAYMNTRLGYLQTLQDYQNAISDLERAVGIGL